MGKRNTTIHLPQLYLKLIDEIICDKEYPCTSELIRVAIRKLIKRDMVLLHNPRIEQTSKEVQALIAKQNDSGLQKNLDQFKVILDKVPIIPKELNQNDKQSKNKQARIDSFWK